MDDMKWLVTFVLLAVCSQAAAGQDFTVTVFSSTSKTMLLRWTKCPGAYSYKITAALQSSPETPVAFATFGQNTVLGSVGSLSKNVGYMFTVEGLDHYQTTLCNASIQSATAPDAMDPIQTVEAEGSTTLKAEFNPRAGATGYVIRVQNNAGFYREEDVASSPALIGSLTPYTEYRLSIMALNGAARSQPSPSVTAKTVLPAPRLEASSPSNDSLVVSWPPVAHAVRYVISIRQPGSGSWTSHNASHANLTIWGLDADSLYTIQGFAWDAEGRQGEGSLHVNQTTRPATPSSVNVSMVTGHSGELSVSWAMDQEVSADTHYMVTSDQNHTCNSSSSPCLLSPVGCGEVYSVRVTAVNQAGPGFPSSPVVFITYPCPPEPLALTEATEGNCTLSWDAVPHADGYTALIQTADGTRDTCNTSQANNCTFSCLCGRTYLVSVSAFNQAGSSPPGVTLNHTTLPCCPETVSVSLVSGDTLGISWEASRGAVLYETRAAHSSEVVLCNDTAPQCTLSDLSCDSSYSVVVRPCNDYGQCNFNCQAHTKDTAPCTPTSLQLTQKNSSCVTVSWTAHNREATYTVSAVGQGSPAASCSTNTSSSCDLSHLPCGSAYQVSVTAASPAGQSLPSFSEPLETAPCCPADLEVAQMTMASTNVSWSGARGADYFITTLTSSRGHARCHTREPHCLMGCITCGTNYTVTMEAYSRSGHSSNCTYQGFSSSACCPSGVRLYRLSSDSVRVHWRGSAGGGHNHTAQMLGNNNNSNNYTCTSGPGGSSCDLAGVQCGDVYTVVVAPLTAEGTTGLFCPQRLYSVTCSGGTVGTVMYRGKRSVD